ncbi:MAG: hypothetical protein WAW35_00995 [Sideroxyarcus sp.]
MLKCPSIATCPPRRSIPWSMLALAGLVMWAGSIGGVHAQTRSATGAIYTCTDSHGKRLTSDRLIAECLDREQRVLNKDGSQRMVIPPRMSPEERAAVETRKRELALAEAARKDAMRRDRNLLMRYPDEATHDKAREAAMDDLHKGIVLSDKRLQELRAERQPLDAETEFYKGKRLPGKLRTQIEANDAQQQAQRDIIQQQRTEMVRLNALYDAELTRLRKMWAGAAPGTVPVASVPSAPAGVIRPVSSSAAR